MTSEAHQGILAAQQVLTSTLLVLLRISAFLVFAPVFGSPAIPARVKVLFALAVALLLGPLTAGLPGTQAELSIPGILGEIAVGITFGLTLSFLSEALLMGAALMSVSFSFSLANLLDPNSQVETEVLGTALNWIGLLVLLGAGLHRTLLAAVLRSFAVVPLGTAVLSARSAGTIVDMASGIFLAGLQLAAPVIAASLMIEVAVGLVSRMAPMMPAQMLSVPLKTVVSYVVLIGSLALWPRWIEQHLVALLDDAQRLVRL